jgi:PKD domain
VSVTAYNDVSSLSSLPVAVQVLREINGLKIEMPETPSDTISRGVLLNAVYMFRAYHFGGTSVEYMWDFGDGSVVQRTTSQAIKHTFTK